jgi:transcription elongation factor Elf1
MEFFEKIRVCGINDIATCPYCHKELVETRCLQIKGGFMVFCNFCNLVFQVAQTDEGVEIYANKDWIK